MKSSAARRRGPFWVAAVLVLGGCSLPPAQEPGTQPPPVGGARASDQWTFSTREHVALWYHGLSYVLPPLDSLPLAIYSAAERERATAFARRRGVSRTPIEAAADSIRREFAGSSSYQQLQFLPLYFDNAEAFFNAFRVWEQSGGDPQRAGSQEGAQAVQLLSGIFETARHQRWVVLFARTLEEERRAYYDAYWQTRESELRTLQGSAQREWLALVPRLRPLLNYLQLTGGEALLTPSLGAEGRTVSTRGLLRSAVGVGAGSAAAADVAHALLHEVLYSLVGDVVKENVAPARLRDIGEDVITSAAATRAGELVLLRLAPERVDAYRRLYLAAIGRSGSTQAAFRAAFPLLPELEQALPRAVEQALAGI